MEPQYRHAPATAASASAHAESPPASPPISLTARSSSRGFQNQNQNQNQNGPNSNAGGSGSASVNGMTGPRPRIGGGAGAGAGTTDSPPRTPPPRHLRNKGKQRRVDQVAEENGSRHSHGLSWNSTTRDSVVDNLLFSLDNLSRGDVGAEAEAQDDDRHRILNSLTSGDYTMGGPSRRRSHTHSSSASEYTASPVSEFSATPKGRRSNSSTHFSIHTTRGKSNGRVNGIPETYAESLAPPDIMREKTSIQNAFGSAMDGVRLGWSGKSASMDNIHAEQSADGLSVLTRGRPIPSVHSRFESNMDGEAAPEPIVAAGPRKMQNPTATGPVYVNPAPKPQPASKPGTLRKVTTQTDLRSANSTQTSLVPRDIRNQAADFVRTSSMRGSESGPPLSAQSNNPAPSPDVTRRRDPSPAREKPGFFKRVFGGSSSRAVSNPIERPVSKQVTQDATDRPDAPDRSTSQLSAGNHSRNETKQTVPATTSQPPPSLNKKPSSFFRRRKKSTSESIALPPLPTNDITSANLALNNKAAAEPSPSISSLRKVMDPFLVHEAQLKPGASSAPKQEEVTRQRSSSNTEGSEDLHLFHSGYTPPLDASLNMRHPLSREQSMMQNSDQEGSPIPKMKLKMRRPDTSETATAQLATPNGYTLDPSSQTSIGTHQDGLAKVSPVSTIFPTDAKHVDLSSRPSTGDRIIASLEGSPVEPGQDMREFSAGTNVSLSMNEEQWGVVTKAAESPRPVSRKKSEYLTLRPTPSEENLEKTAEALVSPFQSAATTPIVPTETVKEFLLPIVQVDGGSILSRGSSSPSIVKLPSTLADNDAEYKERARKIFEGDEEDVVKGDAAAWMGERNTLSTRTLEAYMQLFDFSGMNILAALRMLCNKLVLRGETQQFDRIITALSSRWCECNASHGFKAQDVIHCICYSLILLNTDLHLADIGEKMSRSAYVKNTLPTIKRVVFDAVPNAFEDTLRPTPTPNARPGIPWSDSNSPMASPISPLSDTAPDRPDSLGIKPSTLSAVNTNIKRLSIRPAVLRSDSDTPDSATLNASNALVNNTWTGTMRGWEAEVETVLKYFFTSIKAEPLPLHGAVVTDLPLGNNRNLSVVDLSNGSVRRSGSIISKAPSDNMSYRSKGDLRSMTMRWQSRNNRPRPKVYPASTIGSSRTSFDDGSGFWSPAQSSKYSFNKTLTSASVGSFGYVDPFKHSIGFANALSEAIIREENTGSGGGDSETFSMPGGLLEDESLALEGAPWAKEGLVKHKHHLETPSRKAKERSWNDCFAVVSKGKLTLFAFNTSSKSQSVGRKPFYKSGKAASVTGTRVGGGDWMENAEQLDVFVLRQTIASTLPPPGYSKTRPHVWALSLPSGAVHLFQVGTPDIAEEFITAANYWSARLSKEPLSGGVSNVEYGWSDKVINTALLDNRSENVNSPPVSMNNSRPAGHTPSLSRTSLQSSIRGSFDTGFGSAKAKLPGDKAHLHEWQPPSQSMMASQLLEVDQLRQLTAYVTESEKELQSHQELKHAIELAVSLS